MPATSPFIGPLKNKKELSALMDILALTFNFQREHADGYSAIVGENNYRVLRQKNMVIGGCALLPAGQFFGGNSVPMMGVAAVGIAPEHRGRGGAGQLMKAALHEMHARSFPLAALYPATLNLYRSVGYEHAGNRFDIRIPAKTIIFKKRSADLTMRRIETGDEKAIRTLYSAHAKHCNGALDRSDFHWFRIRKPRGQTTQGFLLENSSTGQVEGYAIYLQKEALPDAPYSLHVTDLLAATPAAGRQLLNFFADHRSMTHEIVFQGGADEPLLKLLPERNYSARLLDHWMLRVVDVGKALAMRGYSSAVSAEVHLDVEDDLITDNNGRYVLTVNNGNAKVDSGGRGDLKIDIRGLAALYSAHLSPHDLRLTGQLSIAPRVKKPDETLAAAQSIFAGPAPWLRDMF